MTEGDSSPLPMLPLPALVPVACELPPLILRSGAAAVFASEEFFFGTIRNAHTRRAYLYVVTRFMAWLEERGVNELTRTTPRDVGQYLDAMRTATTVATRKLHLSALRHFFDALVTRHAVVLNPALSVRGERYAAVEGKTPEIGVEQARKLLASIELSHVVGLRDRAVLAILLYTAARAGAVERLRCGDFHREADQWMLRFAEKGGKLRDIPVRHDLERIILAYVAAAELSDAPKNSPLFRTALGRERKLSGAPLGAGDIRRIMKRRLRDADLPSHLSPHSCRVTTITDLLEQGLALEDVQRLAGHADPRTTRLYDRRDRKVTRNIVERISV